MHLSKNGKLGIVAVVAVALAAGGAAFAATKIHTSSSAQGLQGFGQRPSGYGFPGGQRGGFGARVGGLAAAATYLGLTTQQLFQDLQSGKTLAQIANSTSGKSASGLIDAMVAAERQRLDQAVQAGSLTQAQADQLESRITARVTAMVNGTGFGGRGGGFGGPPGGGNGFGFGPGGGGGGSAPPQGSSPPSSSNQT
jgi:hypothetical protein